MVITNNDDCNDDDDDDDNDEDGDVEQGPAPREFYFMGPFNISIQNLTSS